MTFLQPWILALLPLVSLPLIIHLINQRRFQTVPWAAMMFLLSAKALSRGYSRLRHWLIMALRMAAVAAVILAVGRPLSRGWLALAGGGRPDTAIVILDRSPSMQQRDPAAVDSKLDTGRRQLAESLATLRPSRTVLVTDPGAPPRELADPATLGEIAGTGPTAAASDIPALLQSAYDHIRENAAGTCEVWICSDQRANDWRPEDGAWGSIHDAFAKLPQQVRFQLLTYPETAAGDMAVRVTATKLETRGQDRQLLVSVAVSRQADGDRMTLPLKFEIGGASTSVDVELTGREAVLKNHAITLPRSTEAAGWGRVSIPADANPADNEFYFVFAAPPPRRSLIVAEDSAARRVLELVAGIAPDKDQQAVADVVLPGGLATAAWDDAAVLLWQGQLPAGRDAELVQSFVDRGGQAIFFPPDTPGAGTFAGVGYGAWTTHREPVSPERWVTDEDVLSNTLSGGALPVGEVDVRRSVRLVGDTSPLASLADGAPLFARVPGADGVYFWATTPAPRDSSLAAEGVVLYAVVQRAIDRGLAVLGKARQADAGAAGELADAAEPWQRLAGPGDAVSTEIGLHAGVFAAGERLLALNRPTAEDAARVVADDRIDGLFRDLTMTRIRGRAGSGDSLVQEIWRAFLIARLLALIVEGLLSMPRRQQEPPLGGLDRLEAAT